MRLRFAHCIVHEARSRKLEVPRAALTPSRENNDLAIVQRAFPRPRPRDYAQNKDERFVWMDGAVHKEAGGGEQEGRVCVAVRKSTGA